jgi:hypothetical protein
LTVSGRIHAEVSVTSRCLVDGNSIDPIRFRAVDKE